MPGVEGRHARGVPPPIALRPSRLVRAAFSNFDAARLSATVFTGLHLDLEHAIFERRRGGVRLCSFGQRNRAEEAAVAAFTAVILALALLGLTLTFAGNAD